MAAERRWFWKAGRGSPIGDIGRLQNHGIYFVNADAEPTPRIEFFDFATRRIAPVLSLEQNVPSAEPSLSATADGKTIYYALSDCSGVIKLMTIPR